MQRRFRLCRKAHHVALLQKDNVFASYLARKPASAFPNGSGYRASVSHITCANPVRGWAVKRQQRSDPTTSGFQTEFLLLRSSPVQKDSDHVLLHATIES
jgi:hypothetical protein